MVKDGLKKFRPPDYLVFRGRLMATQFGFPRNYFLTVPLAKIILATMLSLFLIDFSTWYQVLGTKYVPSTWYQVPGTKYLVPSTWYQVLGARYLVPSTAFERPLPFKLVVNPAPPGKTIF